MGMISKWRSKRICIVFTFFFIQLVSAEVSVGQQIDPQTRYQKIEGWGVSLSWWANLVGEYSQTEIVNLCNDLTNPEELNMNLFRYNIHGGDNPDPHAGTTADHFRDDSGLITSYQPSANASYNWSANQSQRKVLEQILRFRPDAILDAISYSPPYWMTTSKCSAGASDGRSNLPEGMEDDFAEFLTDIVKHYHDEYDITFRTLTGLNEPSSGFWRAGGNQEGCGIYAQQQVTLLNEIYDKLEEKGMLSYCKPGGPEESKINTSFNSLSTYVTNELMSKVGQIHTHSYNSIESNRKGISRIAHTHDKTIWQSETGPLGLGVPTSIENNLHVAAEQLIPDLKEMHARGWLDWQAASTSRNWGFYTITVPGSTLTRHKNFYFRKQFSKYLKAGYTIIEIDEEKSVAAISPTNDELVIVHVNPTKSSQTLNYDLSKFESTDAKAKIIRTSASEDTKELSPQTVSNKTLPYIAPAESITTFVVGVSISTSDTQLADGIYELKAKHSGKFMSVSDISSANNANIEQSDYADADNLKFAVSKFGKEYLIKPIYNDKVLSIAGASTSAGASLKQYQEYGDDSQRYFIESSDSEYYKISSVKSSLHLSVANGSTENRADIIQDEDNGSDHFLWEFVFIEPLVVLSSKPENETQQLNIFPNPAKSTFRISGPDGADISMDILSLEGRLIQRIMAKTNSPINVSNLQDGIYLIRMSTSDDTTIRRLVVRH